MSKITISKFLKNEIIPTLKSKGYDIEADKKKFIKCFKIYKNSFSKMKKEMIKTLQDKNSEEVDVLIRNDLRLSNVLSWVKRL